MTDHPIFERFSVVPSETTGIHVFDFIGGATRVAYNRSWATHAIAAGKTVSPNFPPKNEHYLDWIAVLTAASKARGVFRMAEFGAGWGPWLVRGALAAKQRQDIQSHELLAVEADPTHYKWLVEHFEDNGLEPDQHHLIAGAVSLRSKSLRFPDIADPDLNYGASVKSAANTKDTIEISGHTIEDLLSRFSGPLDLLHIDIQGEEYDVLPPAVDLLKSSVKAIMVGTHSNDELHENLAGLFQEGGWDERLNLGRNRVNETPWGEIQTNDGFLWFENSRMKQSAAF